MVRDSEGDSLGGRVRRYAKVGTAVGGLAARLAGDRVFGISIDRPGHARDLKNALGGLKGPLMKVAQILATIPEALPQEYVDELIQLQANAPAMGWLFVKRRMAAELGPDWQDRVDNFEHEAAAAASLGQVHCASLDGLDLADRRVLRLHRRLPDIHDDLGACGTRRQSAPRHLGARHDPRRPAVYLAARQRV